MPADVFDPATHMATLTLHVDDLAGMETYYARALGLTPVHAGAGEVVLGRGSTPTEGLIRLVHTPGLPTPGRDQAGLFHTALLFDTQESLAATVATAAHEPRSRFVGASDHHVSEAFYFTDPEGNGIELYWDRPRDAWSLGQESIHMTTRHLDPTIYLRTHLSDQGLDHLTQARGAVGHVHLQVGDLTTAQRFFVDALGFEITVRYPGALFVSAGGYHHHMAMNVWNSPGAPARAATLGLGEVAISVPTREEVERTAQRLRDHGHEVQDDGHALRVRDPWGSVIAVAPG
ncbi:VOC family protein [Serinibacter salmoneus]|uniref:Catechol 2,3-dioxygenase n=1 Tax=Serinibacter salmoneus TaxID=556530 RepID=A0A2A9CZX3_9MICO|nr:VOC family protein [Serinibacter salmoneus]PFG19943.1 catechol 2,3-dioxygenase [Serinibacter salmoneus]